MRNMKGQVALVVLLISAVVMTVGLSVSRKTVVETKIDADEELLKQAFNAAESGIEYYLGTGQTKWTNISGNGVSSVANVTTQNLGGGSTLDGDELTLQNETNFFWMVGHNADGSINYSDSYSGTGPTLCVDNAYAQSLKVDYFYRIGGGVYRVKRQGYNIGGGTAVNGYMVLNPASNSCTVRSGYKVINLGLIAGGESPLLLVVKPIGGNARILISGSAVFPIQGEKISSTGKAGEVSATTRSVSQRVSILNQYQVPAFMIDALTAGGNVLSN